LAAAEKAGFDLILTADQGLNYQQNLKGLKLALIVLSTNKNSLVIAGAPKIAHAVDTAIPGSFSLVDIGT
jgi:hypothetical protein